MATYKAEGITLLARRFRGTGRVVAFFTRERGKVESVAQGVGKPSSSLAPAVELFAHSELFFAQGRRIDRLTQARVIDSFETLRRDPKKIGYAGYVCELYATATEPGQPMPEAFDDLLEFLHAVTDGAPLRAVTADVVWRFLQRAGVAPELDYCGRCGREIAAQEDVRMVPAEGAVVCPTCLGGGFAEGIQVSGRLRAVARGLGRISPRRVERVNVPEEDWARLLTICQMQIQFHLGIALNAADFLRQLEARPKRRTEPRSGKRDEQSGSDGGG